MPEHVDPLTDQLTDWVAQLSLALQVAVVPPFWPEQVQLQGPVPDTLLALPAPHRPLLGRLLKLPPFEDPHEPLTRVTQLPPLWEKLPWLHEKVRLPVVGWPVSDTLRLLPWLVVATLAVQVEPPKVHEPEMPLQLRLLLQEAVLPPLLPEQVHV